MVEAKTYLQPETQSHLNDGIDSTQNSQPGMACSSGSRPHRGVSQQKLPWYLGFFEFVHNVGVRGKRLLESLWVVLLE